MHLSAKIVLIKIILCLLIKGKVCTLKKSEFVAVVVEHSPTKESNLSPDKRLLKNTEDYIAILNEIDQDLDIIIFPEATLYADTKVRVHADAVLYATKIQDEVTGVSLCSPNKQNHQEHPFLIELACAAQKSKTYLVANVVEKAKCDNLEKCAEDGWNLYNTNVAFDRNGAFVSKYRKFNLFGEFYINQTAEPDISIFETDFGIKFGMFTCFDILFRRPTLELIEKHDIKHFIFTTMWFSELPFLTALQTQHQWAHRLDAILLAAGANSPKRGSGGTGIYQGKYGPLKYGIVSEGGSKAYVATVTESAPEIDINEDVTRFDDVAKQMDNFLLIKDDLSKYTSKIVTANQHQHNEKLCSGTEDQNQICCHFNIETDWDNEILNDNKNHYQYRMVAYSGVRSFTGMYNGGVEICGIVACTNNNINSCNERFEKYNKVSWPVTFRKLSIRANFTIDENKIQHPNSLQSNIRPLPVDAVEWAHKYFTESSVIERSYNLKEARNRILTFAIYGRDFNRDSPTEWRNTIGFNSINVGS